MMEHTTDRLFWTLTSIIVGALLLTVGAKAFPHAANSIMSPMSGVMKQADIATGHVGQANKDSLSKLVGTASSNARSDNDNTSAKTNAVEASTLGFKVTNNGDGTGTINGYNPSKGVNVNIPKYMKNNGTVLKITSIGNYAFENEEFTGEGITSVIIPDSVTSIGNGAFEANKLTSINIPNSVKNMGISVFANNQITSATISNSISKLSDGIFRNNHLTSITIPNSINNIESNAFYNNQLTSIFIPNTVTNIGPYAFQNNKLTSLNIPNLVTNIGEEAFANNQLKSVTMPNSITNIGREAFAYNLNLTAINIPNAQGCQSAKSNNAFYFDDTNITNNPE